MQLTKFFHCTTCNKKVIATYNECPDCGLDFGGQSPLSEKAVDKKIAELAANTQNESASVNASEDHMECSNPVCQGKMYPLGTSMCPDCGMPLHIVPAFNSEDLNNVKNINTADSVNNNSGNKTEFIREEAKEVNAPTEDNAEFIYGDEIEKPVYNLTFKMYSENNKADTVTIPLNRTIIPIGRIYLCEHVFSEYNRETTKNRLARVSRHNGFILQDKGKLYVQYDRMEAHGGNAPKAEIRINNKPIKDNVKNEIHAGDSVSFGFSDTRFKSLFIDVANINAEKSSSSAQTEFPININQNNSQYKAPVNKNLYNMFNGVDLSSMLDNVNFDAPKSSESPKESTAPKKNSITNSELLRRFDAANNELREQNNELRERLDRHEAEINKQNEKIDKNVEKLDSINRELVELSKKYENEINEERKSGNMTDDDYLNEFFKDTRNSALVYFLSDEQKELLVNAAILEYRCKRECEAAGDERTATGYKAPVRLLAGLIESFIFEIIDSKFINTYASTSKKNQLADMKEANKETFLNDLQWIFIHSEGGVKRFNNAEITKMTKDYLNKLGVSDDDEIRRVKNKIGNQFIKINDLREIRNTGSHKKPAYIPGMTEGDEKGYFDYYKEKAIDVNFYRIMRELKNVLIDGQAPNPRVKI